MPPIISVVGKSESGKTTLLEKLIPELKKRGYKIGTIKHAHHGFDIDESGKDSWRHKKAGADSVLVASPGKIAMVKNDSCDTLSCLEKYLWDMDLIITEGYKRGDKPKIEIFRAERHKEPVCLQDNHLIAFVTDSELNVKIPPEIPLFSTEEIEGLADLIVKKYL